jgi:hypothetical protein
MAAFEVLQRDEELKEFAQLIETLFPHPYSHYDETLLTLKSFKSFCSLEASQWAGTSSTVRDSRYEVGFGRYCKFYE